MIDSPVRESQTATAQFSGESGDAVFLFAGLSSTFIPGLEGVLVVDPAAGVGPLFVGTIFNPNSGLSLGVALPPLPASVEGETVFLQAATQSSAGIATLDGVSTLAWIQAGF